MNLGGREGPQGQLSELARVDALVEELKGALRRNGLQLPSLRSDVMPTRGTYLLHLGRVSHEIARDLIAVLNLAADLGADPANEPLSPGTAVAEAAVPHRFAEGRNDAGGERARLRS